MIHTDEPTRKPPLVIIAGPTAVGKSDLAVMLAKKIGGEIISADSMQVYKGMDIGTAKMTPEEMQGVPHYMIDELEPQDAFNVVSFQQMAKAYCMKVIEKGKIPILTGGTGFYIQSLLYDIDFSEEDDDDSIRLMLEEQCEKMGKEALHAQLKEVDPESAAAIPAGNIKRVIRALEFFRKHGTKISEHNAAQRSRESIWNEAFFVLADERDIMYEKIDRRVEKMKSMGLLEEVKRLRDQGCTKTMVSMQGIGYRQILAALDGAYELDQAYEEIKKDTRHFAKRQLTWFHREKNVIWLEKKQYADNEAMLEKIRQVLHEKQIL